MEANFREGEERKARKHDGGETSKAEVKQATGEATSASVRNDSRTG